jgi:maintenance of morphology protein 1
MLEFSFLPDYDLELSTRSLVGSRSRLQDVPKIAQLVEARLHAWFDERCVEPCVQQIVLPSFWPRKKNTRGGGEGEEESEGSTFDTSGDVNNQQQEYNMSGTDEERENMEEMINDPDLEARMTAQDRILKEVFADNSKQNMDRQRNEGLRRRGHGPRGGSMEEWRMPGRFV